MERKFPKKNQLKTLDSLEINVSKHELTDDMVIESEDFLKLFHKSFVEMANSVLFNRSKKFLLETEEQKHFYGTMLRYVSRSPEFYDSNLIQNKENVSLDKGILICGTNGVGKTFIFDIMHKMYDLIKITSNEFSFSCADEIVELYNIDGSKGIQNFFKGQRYFDDIGSEERGSHYGQSEVIRVLIERRHRLFLDSGNKTFLTTNYSYEELLKRYGSRSESRLFEMFNILVVTGPDRRKIN